MYENEGKYQSDQETVYLDGPSLLEHVYDIVGESDGKARGNIIEKLFYFGQAGGADLGSRVNYLGVCRIEEFDGFLLKRLFYFGFVKNFFVF
jgi:hypothetical protein